MKIIHFHQFFLLIFICINTQLKANVSKLIHNVSSLAKQKIPTITVSCQNDPKKFVLTSSFLRAKPYLELYNQEICNEKNISREETIKYRYSHDTINTEYLTELLENLIEEIKQGKTQFTHFRCITDLTFNWKMSAGALVLKFKNYPFIVKLFIESPYSFTQPYKKGFEAYALFRMGGGISRHLAGFSRLTNHEEITKIIQDSSLQELISLPRKWFWQPQIENHLIIEGYLFKGLTKNFKVMIPSIYAIIADEIQSESSFSLLRKEDRIKAFYLFNTLGNRIDPNPNNFFIEKNSTIPVLIDTEYWPALIGVTKKPEVPNYVQYYCYFGPLHCLRNFIFGMPDKNGNTFENYFHQK